MQVEIVNKRKIKSLKSLIEAEYYSYIKKWLDCENKEAIVAKNETIESILLMSDNYVEFIYTFPNYRRKGNADKLLDFIKERNDLTVHCTSDDSIKLFEKNGFKFYKKVEECTCAIYKKNQMDKILVYFPPKIEFYEILQPGQQMNEKFFINLNSKTNSYSEILKIENSENFINELYSGGEILNAFIRNKLCQKQLVYCLNLENNSIKNIKIPNSSNSIFEIEIKDILFGKLMWVQKIILDLTKIINYPSPEINKIESAYGYSAKFNMGKIIINFPTLQFGMNMMQHVKILFDKQNLNIDAEITNST